MAGPKRLIGVPLSDRLPGTRVSEIRHRFDTLHKGDARIIEVSNGPRDMRAHRVIPRLLDDGHLEVEVNNHPNSPQMAGRVHPEVLGLIDRLADMPQYNYRLIGPWRHQAGGKAIAVYKRE